MTIATAPETNLAEDDADGPYRVMIVDDSAVIRGVFRKTLETDPDISVVASVGNGQFALESLKRQPVEVVVLDIEMPVMDGMTALPEMLKLDPEIKVIMASTLTLKNAGISLQALQAGAADYIPKPTSKSEIHSSENFKRELVEKIKALGLARRGRSPALKTPPSTANTTPANTPPVVAKKAPLALREPSKVPPKLIAIGSSTGGPQALQSLIGGLKNELDLPILITQHMPPTFTQILAEHLAKTGQRPCFEAEDGMRIEPGKTYVAPGGYHMVAEKQGVDVIVRLNSEPPENFCRPAVDPMLRSLAEIYQSALLVVILTGMGQDGLKGCQNVIDTGGTVIAQDEASSVVWGMPGAVSLGGLCSAVLPLPNLPSEVLRLSRRSKD